MTEGAVRAVIEIEIGITRAETIRGGKVASRKQNRANNCSLKDIVLKLAKRFV